MSAKSIDVLIIGAGHNGLVAAIFLARAGLKVTVVEEKSVVGGAAKTEFPFAKAPKLGTSTGAGTAPVGTNKVAPTTPNIKF